MSTIASRILEIRKNMDEICRGCDRPSEDVRLMIVSKTRGWDEIEEARRAGGLLFGENRVQEAADKWQERGQRRPKESLHLIGHLQSNKAAQATLLFDCIQSVDSLKLLKKMERSIEGRSMPVYLEYNMSGDGSKYGYDDKKTFFESVEFVMNSSAFTLEGLMTIGPLGGAEAETRSCFASLRDLSRRMREQFPGAGSGLSMGMSSDYGWAIEEGSTLVRVGSSIFGPRY